MVRGEQRQDHRRLALFMLRALELLALELHGVEADHAQRAPSHDASNRDQSSYDAEELVKLRIGGR